MWIVTTLLDNPALEKSLKLKKKWRHIIQKLIEQAQKNNKVYLLIPRLPWWPANVRNVTLIPGSGRFPRGGNGNPLQYSCLGNPMDRGTWWATVHGITKSETQLSDSTTATLIPTQRKNKEEKEQSTAITKHNSNTSIIWSCKEISRPKVKCF